MFYLFDKKMILNIVFKISTLRNPHFKFIIVLLSCGTDVQIFANATHFHRNNKSRQSMT